MTGLKEVGDELLLGGPRRNVYRCAAITDQQ